MSNSLTELDRRVLATLPAWAEDEDAVIAAEGGPERSVRSHSLEEMHAELAANPHARVADAETAEPRAMTLGEVNGVLHSHADEGWSERGEDGRWRMTAAGFEILHVPDEAKRLSPAPAAIEPDPVSTEAAAEAVVGEE